MEQTKPVSVKVIEPVLYGDTNYTPGEEIHNVPTHRASKMVKVGKVEIINPCSCDDMDVFQEPGDEKPHETATPPNVKEVAITPKVSGNGKPTPPKVD